MPPLRHPVPRQLLRRLIVALMASALLTTLVSAWFYHTANDRAAKSQLASAHEHYAAVFSGLEQRWGREAYNFKVRIESMRFLEHGNEHKEKLQANLTAQGGSLEFPSLRIEDAKGLLVTSFEHANHKIPKVRFLPEQDSTWTMDPATGQLYMVFRQQIWLGKENGYLLLFKPMDHALLSLQSYPFTRISLWWKGKPVASSEGTSGLETAAAAYGNPAANPATSRLPWPGAAPENAPLLFIESTSPPLLNLIDLAGPLVLSLLAFALAAWAILGTWGSPAVAPTGSETSAREPLQS